jgi:hypothetical protein
VSTTVVIGYGNGYPLETTAVVDLLVNGEPVATANPDTTGRLIFGVDIPQGATAALRLDSGIFQEAGTTS